MVETRIKISSIVESQLPAFVRDEYPLVSEFLSQYYKSLENQGQTLDILQNIDKYTKLDNLTNLVSSTTLSSDISFADTTIQVESTYGFANNYGLLLIDNEIITYTSKTSTSFEGCVRGFSGVTSYTNTLAKDQLVFSESDSVEHNLGATVTNLSILFLKEFYKKVKKQIVPGFEDREFYSELNESLFIKQAKDFYSTKGTNTSFEILFRALYGQDVEVVKPRDFLIQPSDAEYRVSQNLVVESISGDPLQLENKTLYQDFTNFFSEARGTVTQVEEINRGNKNYYVISLDYGYNRDINLDGSILGSFSIHPKTKIVTAVSAGTTVLDVDSTVGFPTTGTLVATLSNGTVNYINYGSKTINQFFDCKNINQPISSGQEINLDAYAYGYAGINTDSIVKVRVTGVLSDLEIPKNTRLYSKGDQIVIRSLGKELEDAKSNNWFFNISTKFDVSSVQLLDSVTNTYKINLYDLHKFSIGDSITCISSVGTEQTGNVIFLNDEKSFTIQGQGQLNTLLSYTIKKNILKVNSSNYPNLSIFNTNVQNIYTDPEESIYVASSSIPTYLNQSLTIKDRSVSFNGTFNGTDLNIGVHGFYTGDSVVYSGDIIDHGIYFVQKIDDVRIRIARSRANIGTNNFITVNGTIKSGKFIFTDFCYDNLNAQVLESQKLVRKLIDPQDDSNSYETSPGPTGIFINGVELLNYKSKDNIYYGPIENIIPISPGKDYDVINPPILTISDSVGTGASAYCSVIGKLERIDIVDPGFDYLEEPVITFSGGNGFDASARAKLVSFDHSVDFNSESTSGLVNLTNNTIAFSDYHKFRDAEEIIYNPRGQTAVAGLVTNSTYFVSVQDSYTVKIHKSFNDAVVGINTIDLTNYGIGNHTFKCVNKKKKIGSITIENSGFNYQNKKTTVTNVGIDTSADIITINNHGYESGEIIAYTPGQTSIGGLTTSSYYVTKLNENQFKLSNIGFGTVGVSTGISNFYYKTKQYVNLTSTGSGTHVFNYPPINVQVTGRIGVSTIIPQNFSAIIQPIFRGNINSVFVESGGSSYGSEDILNYNKQPNFLLNSGSGCQLTPVISNGQIVDVIINSSGSGYNSPPTLILTGDGSGALLTPILSNGTIISVKIISGGLGYTKAKTYITVDAAGQEANFACQIKSWKIDLVKRLIETKNITDDDGVIDNGINRNLGLEYTHAYAPRNLRKSVLSTSVENGVVTKTPDLQVINNAEQKSLAHSPIIGWAYDGNPIYGPYGYSSISGGSIRLMKSGYELVSSSYRPSTALYPLGFFVEDYEFTNVGDLDEFNGRFCITPEYPNGVYAYFCTVNSNSVDTTGSFQNYRRPIFPYVIGNYFKSKPIDFNFLGSSNQDQIDFKGLKLLRNTTPYNLTKTRSGYDFLLNPDKIKKQVTEIKNVSTGNIQNIGISTGGTNYQVGDKINFDSSYTSGRSVYAKVSSVIGKEITQVSTATSSFDNVEIIPSGNSVNNFVGFSTVPHNFSNGDLVTLTSQYELNKSSLIKVSSNILTLTSGIGSAQYTGIVTYFNVSGFLDYPRVRENDIYQIQNEQIKILNVDKLNSRIRVLRNYNDNSGLVTYSSGIALSERTRKFELNFGISSTSYQYNLNKELYFNPKESIGLGNSSGVGIGSTLIFSNAGSGLTSITIPTQSIYLPNHQLNTGEVLIYSNNGGDSISVSTNGQSSFTLTNNSIVYAAKISNDLIGISTFRVGLGTTGTFVSVGSTNASILYFTGIGTNVYHSFRTRYANILSGKISKNLVTVSTASSHGLLVGDSVTINVIPGISTNVSVKYDDYNRRMVLNPRSFVADNIDTLTSIITINNHGYKQGQKLIHTSSSPSGGLVNEQIYYVIVIDPDRIKLSNSLYNANQIIPNFIKITSASLGTLSEINPSLDVTKNQTIIFDLSDSSLSFTQNGIKYSAFDFDFYTDSDFKNKFNSSSSTTSFEVAKNGSIGISSDASVTLKLNNNVPTKLYYNLKPVNLNNNNSIKEGIVTDTEQLNYNKIVSVDSFYNGVYNISGITSNTFNYNILNHPEKQTYSSSESILTYHTNSNSAFGGINSITILSKGTGYLTLPKITSVTSLLGNKSIIFPDSSNIGNVTKKEILDIGFDYSVDYTVRPTARLPIIVKVDPFYSFDSIGVSSVGKNYYIAPNLVVLDGFTNNVVPDVKLEYKINPPQVNILTNTTGLYNVTPKIIPTNNVNGVGISSIRFIPTSKDVIVTLGASFSNSSDFPFAIGDKVLIEGISVGVGSTGKGYDSSVYNYALFTLTAMDPNIGGIGATVVYNLSNYLLNGEIPGIYDANNSFGRIIPEKHFPIFNSILKINTFYEGEEVFTSSSSGKVQSWDDKNGYLKIISSDDFYVDDRIKGRTSNSQALIESIISSIDATYDIESSSVVKSGWKKETGFLSNNLQRTHDSNYYQYFSYALKSKVPYDTWESPVSNLNHTSGFKKFSDLIIESEPQIFSGISTSQDFGDFTSTFDLSSFIDLNCVNDFDLAREISINNNNVLKSNEIIFNSKSLQDYFESVGNRVLVLDDISTRFNNNPRSTPFSVVDNFKLSSSRFKKYIFFIEDARYSLERQIILLTILHNNTFGFLNQYAADYTTYNMGYFDFVINGDEGNILFYPNKSQLNSFDVNYLSYSIKDTLGSNSTQYLGNIARITSGSVNLPVGTTSPTTVVGIASTYRASKVLIEIGAADGSYYESTELTVIHDGSNVSMLEYGDIYTDSLTPYSSVGLGTYNAYLSGSNLNIDFKPNNPLSRIYNVNSVRTSISNGSSTGIGTVFLSTAAISSKYVSIASSTSPIANTISTYDVSHDGAYYLVCVEDTTNNRYQISEVVVIDDDTNAYCSEFGVIQTHTSLGTISANTSGSNTNLYFTPISGIDVQVRVVQNAIGLLNNSLTTSTYIDLNNVLINTNYGSYEGTEFDVRKSFNLTSGQKPVFERYFNGQESTIVNVSTNQIKIPNHFFVTGEEVSYTYSGSDSTRAIGIATTSIAGVGLTTKLPSTVYIVKNDDLYVQVAASASEALKQVPTVLDFTTTGIGTFHKFTSKKQNSKVLISIDNFIQTPIVSTAVTSTLSSDVLLSDDRINLVGVTSFFGGDLIKIDDEIMRITSIGVGTFSNRLAVQRPWMGTGVSTHVNGSLVTKIIGDYNIVDNVINFNSAPYGLTPIGTTTNPPDERDYVGVGTHSTFSGRSFIKSGIPDTTYETYWKNNVFDDISSNFVGLKTEFTLKSNGSNVSGIVTSNAVILLNNIFQGPARPGGINISGDYTLKESSGITSISFIGFGTLSASYDVNTKNIARGGIIVSVGSTSGFGYQPLVSAGGTAIVSGFGTISSISIGNSGSGYRSGIQTVRVGVTTLGIGTANVQYVGVATVSAGHIIGIAITNPGIGYTRSNPPIVVFDAPLSYSNVPLVYSSSSVSGFGTEATVDIVVGQGSSVISFEIKNTGYRYGQGEILTIKSGGTTGIPTNTTLPFKEFQITVDRTFSDKFNGWSIGDLQVFDPLDGLFDGSKTTFPLKYDGVQTTIRSKRGSNIDIQATLLVFINNILQVPGQGYIFNGGSTITFPEAPKVGDTSKIIFYKGTGDVDVTSVDILETIKIGDNVTLTSDTLSLQEEERLVTDIISTDIINTNVYVGPGVTLDSTISRPVLWCRQTEDRIIDGQQVAKDRTLYEPNILPVSYLINNVSSTDTILYVDNLKTFFDSTNESSADKQKVVTIISQNSLVSASATAVVANDGTISSIVISNGGFGYNFDPSITIGNPLGTGQTALAVSGLGVGGTVSTTSITFAGTGYTYSNPPVVLFEPPKPKTETIKNVSYQGDFGSIVGFGTTTISNSTQVIFDFYIPQESYLRNASIVGSAYTVSSIASGDYFTVYNSNIGSASTTIISRKSNGDIIGIGTQFVDNIYQVADKNVVLTTVTGIGTTYVTRIFARIAGLSTVSFGSTFITFDSTLYKFDNDGTVGLVTYSGGITTAKYLGNYSWGKITLPYRNTANTYESYGDGRIGGISTSSIVVRTNPLKYQSYVS